MEILLKEHEIEDFLTKSVDEHEETFMVDGDNAQQIAAKNKLKEELKKKERNCNSLIVQRVDNNYLEYIKDKSNPKEVWSALNDTFDRKGVSNRMLLRRELLTLKMNENETLGAHLLKFDKILRDLKSTGAKMDDEDVICQLLITSEILRFSCDRFRDNGNR